MSGPGFFFVMVIPRSMKMVAIAMGLASLAGCVADDPRDLAADGAQIQTLEWDATLGLVVSEPEPAYVGTVTVAYFRMVSNSSLDGSLSWPEDRPAQFRVFFLNNDVAGDTTELLVTRDTPFNVTLSRGNFRVELSPAREATAANAIHLALTGPIRRE